MKRILVIAIGLLLTGTLSASAQGRGGPPPDPGHGMQRGAGGLGPVGRILRQLDLSDEQRQQVRDRVDQAMDGDLGRLMRDQGQKRRELGQLIHDPGATESAITAAAESASADAGALAVARHRLFVSVLEVLTPEQRDQALELLAQGPQRMHRRGPRGPYDPGEEEED